MWDPSGFSSELWSDADLGDERRTQRAAAALALVSECPRGSFVEACAGDSAQQERLYRFVRDARTDPKALIDAGGRAIARLAARTCTGDIAVIQDTTSYGFAHSVAADLGDLGGKATSKRRGFFSHVSLAVDPEHARVLGPVDLDLAIRPSRVPERDNKKLPYEVKESFKWEAAATVVDERCAGFRERLVFISDRESDVYEYLMAMMGSGLRFVVRSSWDRRLDDGKTHLREKVAQAEPSCRVQVRIEQKGGRAARNAVLEVRALGVRLDGRRHSHETLPPLDLAAVHLSEFNAPEGTEPIDWLLLTTEPIGSVDEVLRVARLYCLRWLIEEYNKCCKSDGTDIEALRMQTPDNLIRAAVLCMFAAVPIMQLRGELLEKDARARWPVRVNQPVPENPVSGPCTQVLSAVYWLTLWRATERGQPLPKEPPSCSWALKALARLGGWGDTKRTGRPGYPAVWKGWDKLLERVDAVQLTQGDQGTG